MSKLGLVLRELHRSENGLARDLAAIADRHRAEHEVFHVGHDLARWSRQHVERIAEVAADHGVRAARAPTTRPARLVAAVARRTGVLLGHRPETGLLLLADLRRLHRKAAGVSLDWEVLAQAAQAMRERRVFELARACHPETLRQMRWANAQLKEHAPQVIAS